MMRPRSPRPFSTDAGPYEIEGEVRPSEPAGGVFAEVKHCGGGQELFGIYIDQARGEALSFEQRLDRRAGALQ